MLYDSNPGPGTSSAQRPLHSRLVGWSAHLFVSQSAHWSHDKSCARAFAVSLARSVLSGWINWSHHYAYYYCYCNCYYYYYYNAASRSSDIWPVGHLSARRLSVNQPVGRAASLSSDQAIYYIRYVVYYILYTIRTTYYTIHYGLCNTVDIVYAVY